MELEIKPLNGIGFLEFGMDSVEVGQFNHVYGDPIRPDVEPFIYEFSQEEIDDLRSDLGGEGLKAILDVQGLCYCQSRGLAQGHSHNRQHGPRRIPSCHVP